jgi:hypothetical protein
VVCIPVVDIDWCRENGELVHADSGCLVALLSGRTLPDGRTLQHT